MGKPLKLNPTQIPIPVPTATHLADGAMSAEDKIKLDGLGPGGGVSDVIGVAPIASTGGATPNISITPATALAPGSMSAADKAKLDSLPVNTESGGPTPAFGAQVLTRYVRSTGSNVTGDGLSPATAWLTPEYAAQATKVPLGAILKIDMTGYGTYTPAAPWQPPFVLGARSIGRIRFANAAAPEISEFGTGIQYGDLLIYASPTTDLNIAGSTYTTSVDAVTGRVSYTQLGAGWVVNQWADKMLVVGTGTGTGLTRIVSNTVDTLVTTGGSFFFTPPGTTAPLRIQSESCTIDLATAGFWFYGGTRRRYDTFTLSMAGIKQVNGFFMFFQAGFTGLNLTGCTLCYGDTDTSDNTTIAGCRIYDSGGGSNQIFADAPRTEITNTIVRNTFLIVNTVGSLIGFFLDMEGINGFGDGVYHGSTGTMPVNPLVSLAYSEVRNSVGAFRGVNPSWFGIVGFVRFTNCSYGGIRMERGAQCIVNGYLAGTGNGGAAGGAGMTAVDNSQILIEQTAAQTNVALNAANCTIGGVIGDMLVGANAYRSMVSFFGSPPISLEADYLRAGCRIYQRTADNQLANFVSALPAPSAAYRGVPLTVLGGVGVADSAAICLKKADGTYSWNQAVTQSQYLAETVGAVSADTNTATLPANSGALFHVTVSCVSNNFSSCAYFSADVLVRRNGSGDGSVASYSLIHSSIDLDLTGISISVSNTLVAGVLSVTVNGKSGRNIDWTITVQPFVATQGQ